MWSVLAVVCACLNAVVGFLHLNKKTVCLGFLTYEHAIETHPLGTSKRRRLHIVGTLDKRYMKFVELAIASTVLEGRDEHRIGFSVDDFLYIG